MDSEAPRLPHAVATFHISRRNEPRSHRSRRNHSTKPNLKELMYLSTSNFCIDLRSTDPGFGV